MATLVLETPQLLLPASAPTIGRALHEEALLVALELGEGLQDTYNSTHRHVYWNHTYCERKYARCAGKLMLHDGKFDIHASLASTLQCTGENHRESFERLWSEHDGRIIVEPEMLWHGAMSVRVLSPVAIRVSYEGRPVLCRSQGVERMLLVPGAWQDEPSQLHRIALETRTQRKEKTLSTINAYVRGANGHYSVQKQYAAGP